MRTYTVELSRPHDDPETIVVAVVSHMEGGTRHIQETFELALWAGHTEEDVVKALSDADKTRARLAENEILLADMLVRLEADGHITASDVARVQPRSAEE